MLVYFISGLGADHRVFKNLELPGIEMKFLPWLIPEKDESLHDYASRMIRGIDTSEPVRIVGVSFGGIMAQTIASMITCRQIVLISSVRSPEAYHKFVKWVSKVRLDKVFPMAGLQHFPRKGMDYYFGLETREDSDLLRDMIGHADKYLLR
ncbi:MAG: hypothetical protein KDD54_05800, partial [Flavobacteriales bacterium]|nr:hypothetical protein [Flavobacteriales bacterium]